MEHADAAAAMATATTMAAVAATVSAMAESVWRSGEDPLDIILDIITCNECGGSK
jgi:hypothetical protein